MIGLGVESTAHTFSCAILEKKGKQGKVLSDVRKIYRPPEGEGIHPREASRHHIENSATVLSECLQESGITIKDLDIISYAAGPGLGPCLRVGAVVARSLASYYDIPIYPVNHAIGHIELGKLLTGAKNPLVLLVSGGHTMLLAFLNKQWRVFGETLDITLGQLLDQFGRSLGFASPCGKNIESLATSTSNYVLLPYSVKGNDVSFSGLLSATKSIIPQNKADACFSLQETAFAMISEVVERALSFTNKKELLIVGGVAANKRLSEMLQDVCKRHHCRFFVAPQKYAGDCGSQICWTGLLEAQVKKGVTLENTFVTQSWRLDSVKVDY
ncbi:KEOPS complex N(6)-L-threonylcarbamoyladenine synthase Kae1 [Candidatus Nitrosarchaeum limnium]|jgi:N6-L-threonylcarbamoyladenine synthase|uniref:tRNA N6-adenosine threonylcarbamoyltransferase n=1 Tax=Candidatus Nitrosarchaeum limnium BG20 TaxID=859192 RepID=S2EIC7_9ARCH|nr:KEOPS complex N(6)-L-threonylcarbamoyladenine synthase Kae1 [Candidatus Nitrosarchaeum limnium]EPA04502.1 metallohydrolase, glycoprotease/Kae1 family [Candidatus Nitrosarchaeum limnium BG20]